MLHAVESAQANLSRDASERSPSAFMITYEPVRELAFLDRKYYHSLPIAIDMALPQQPRVLKGAPLSILTSPRPVKIAIRPRKPAEDTKRSGLRCSEELSPLCYVQDL